MENRAGSGDEEWLPEMCVMVQEPASLVNSSMAILPPVPHWKQLYHKWRALRTVPFRSRWFVGYDLAGNSYWEFTNDNNLLRLRRIKEPVAKREFVADAFDTPPQWLQWLRHARKNHPTLEELVEDQQRQARIRVLAQQADQRWALEGERQKQETEAELKRELHKVEQRNEAQADPWAQADASTPAVEQANIKLRR